MNSRVPRIQTECKLIELSAQFHSAASPSPPDLMSTGRRLIKNRSLTVLLRPPLPCRHASTAVASAPHAAAGDGGHHGEEHRLRSLAAARTPSDAVLAFRSLDPSLRRTPHCNDILRSLLRSGEPAHRAEALALLRHMLRPDSACPPDRITCSILFFNLSKRSRPVEDESLHFVVQMAKMGFFRSDAFQFTELVNKLCCGGGTARAWDFVHAVKDACGAIETPVCNALLAGLARDREFRKMNLFFSEMKDMGVRPNVVTCGILINHLCKSRRVDEALNVLDVMTRPDSEVSPDTVTFNTIIDGLCKVGRLDDALALLDRMRIRHGCSANTVTYNSLIDGLCKTGEMVMAHELVARMEREGVSPSVVTLNTLVYGMCRHGRLGSALDFFRQKRHTWADVRGNAVTYSTLISAFLHSNNVGKSMDLFDEMVDEGHSPDSVIYFTLISGLSQVGRLEDACSVVSSMKKNGFQLDTKSYNILISGFCKKKKLDKACEMLQEMEEAGLQPDVFTYNTLIAASCKAGDFPTVDQLLNKMVDDGCKPSVVTYGALIHGYCKAGNLDEALKIFQNMDAAGVPPNTVIYNSLIGSFCKDRKIDIAISLMDRMQKKGVPPDVITYNAIFKGLRDRNMSDKAFQLMDQMRQEGCNPDYVTMDILTEWLSAIGEMERLRCFLNEKGIAVSQK